MKLDVSVAYLHMDDHALEERVTESFGFLKPRSQRAGDLMMHICETVLADYPGLLPVDMIESFQKLLRDLE